MYYAALISIVLVLFLLLKDKKMLSKEEIQKNNNINEIEKRKEYIKQNIQCVLYKENINIEDIKSDYVLLYREDVILNNELLEEIYLNYVIQKEKPSAFGGRYVAINNKNSFKEKLKGFLYSNLLNYVCIFDKDNIDNYFIIMLKKEELEKLVDKQIILKEIVSFDSNKICISIKYTSKKDRRDIIEKYLYSIRNMSIKTTLRIGLFIFTGGTITLNLVNTILNLEGNIYNFLIAIFMYYCYSIVTRYIFKAIGQLRYIATYLFPIYIISYLITYIYIVIDKKHIS